MEHHGTIKLYHLFLLGSSNMSNQLQPSSRGHGQRCSRLQLATWSGLRVHPWTSHPLQRWDRWEWSGGGFTEDHVAFRITSVHVLKHFGEKCPFMFWTCCIHFNLILHSCLFMFLSFSAAIKHIDLRKAICSNRQVGIRPNARGFSDSVLFLLSFCYRFGGLCRLPCSGFMNMYMYKLVNYDF